MVALFFIPVVVLVVVVSIAERKRESVRERETSAGNIQTGKKREKGTQKPPKRHTKTKSPFPPPIFVLSFGLSFVLSFVFQSQRTRTNRSQRTKRRIRMREAAWQNRIDELEQLLREAEEKVNERDAIFLEGVPTTTTTTTRKEERKRAQESGRYRSSNRSSSSSISSSNDGKNNNNRLTAEGRRKLTTFAAKLSELSSASSTTATASGEDITTAMVIRSRSATIEQLRVRGEATLLKLKATPGSIARAVTTTTIKSRASVLQPNEEEEEATTLLQFQHQLLREQDEELTDLSNHVTRTKHIAIAVGEELDLHTRLLDDFDDDVEHTAGNLKRIASSARRLFERIGKSNFSLGCCLAALVFMLIVLIALSILKVEGKFHPIFT